MSDDALLANIIRSVIHSSCDGGYGGYWFVGVNHITLDLEVDITPEQREAIERCIDTHCGQTACRGEGSPQ